MKNEKQYRHNQMFKRIRKRINKGGYAVLAILVVFSMLFTGCQENPDSSIVVNKDMDHLIELAGNTETGVTDVAETVEGYQIYQAQFEDESLKVSVTADALVDIPETETLSVLRVEQAEFTQDFVDTVINEVMGEEEALYDSDLLHAPTRAYYEKKIQEERQWIEEAKIGISGIRTQEQLDNSRREAQEYIDFLQVKYEQAPLEIDPETCITDGMLHDTSYLYQKNPNDLAYAYQYDLNRNGSFLNVVTGDLEVRKRLYVQNNPGYGNCIRYLKDRMIDLEEMEFEQSLFHDCYIAQLNLDEAEDLGGSRWGSFIWKVGEEIPDFVLDGFSIDIHHGTAWDISTEDISLAPTTISIEEAVELGDEFLKALGIEDFAYDTGGLYHEIATRRQTDQTVHFRHNTWYILRYMRKVDGVFVTFDPMGKHEEGWEDDVYVKKDWKTEVIELRINDDGIAGFTYNAPLEITDTLVDAAAMKSFEEVRKTFEQMVVVKYASNSEYIPKKEIEINRVVLGYARISEADSYDTGLLVPVWDFVGAIQKLDTYYGEIRQSGRSNVLTINAIDGSIIDRELGY